MSTRSNTPPLGIGLLLLAGVAVVAGLMSSQLLGYLSDSSIGQGGPAWWVPLLSIGMPALAILAIVAFLWLIK